MVRVEQRVPTSFAWRYVYANITQKQRLLSKLHFMYPYAEGAKGALEYYDPQNFQYRMNAREVKVRIALCDRGRWPWAAPVGRSSIFEGTCKTRQVVDQRISKSFGGARLP